ncbi:MAG: hypothetical protein JO140_03095 [Candidatus Eremiobacteraeota bacterium]|nr:hypothetical protein [Candidatus Eremiobacteraeota bacterium]
MLAAFLIAALTLVDLGGRKLVIEQPSVPARGVILLLPGGATTLSLAADGSTSSSNFVIRSRKLLQNAGFVTAYLDDPGDLREPLARLRALGRPLVILATSRGTALAVRESLRLGKEAGADLVVLTSPVTSGVDSLEGFNVRRLAIPVLVVENSADGCPVTRPSGAAALAERLGSNGTYREVTSSAAQGDACGGLSPHGFLGIEGEVAGKIVEWILTPH